MTDSQNAMQPKPDDLSATDGALPSASQARTWAIALVVFLALVYLLRDVLTPFLAGLAIAYFLDPVADRLERMGLSRTLATSLITVCFFGAVIGLLLTVFPLLQSQVTGFISRLPDYIAEAEKLIAPFVADIKTRVSSDQMQQLSDAVRGYGADAVKWFGRVLSSLWSGGMALFGVLSVLVITPLVSFYMLRDWDRLTAKIKHLLPRKHEAEICVIAGNIDKTMAGFVRGQASVCLLLGAFYGIALSIAGLEFGLVVGLATGILSFIPYFGMGIGLVVGLGIAFVQYGGELAPILVIALIFGAGQILEGFFLTPKLVGQSVGLHPVWVIFALMAGGALFGFAGVLLALPMAAVIGVLIRHFAERYLQSSLYGAEPGETPSEAEPGAPGV